ncbi:MAG: carboxypeptidase regulatory-like domain-containing protein [Bryobacterales bacterium]|nr:carboxypeptidase regulatory-like domain-containing protein [Bryobacterales bacterium]
MLQFAMFLRRKRSTSVLALIGLAFMPPAALPGLACTARAAASAGGTASGTVSGRVLDSESGDRLEGVTVRLFRVGAVPSRELGAGAAPLSARSGESGTFELAGIPGGDYELQASYPGYLDLGAAGLPQTVTLRSGGCQHGLTLRMFPESAIRGHVSDPDGSGMADVQVSAFVASQGQFREVRSARTDPSGGFVLDRIPAGNYVLRALPPKPFGAPTYYPSSTAVDGAAAVPVPRAREIVGIRIVASRDPVHQIRGRVDDFRGVLGGQAATVYLVPRSTSRMHLSALAWSASLDSRRSFVFSGVPAGVYTLQLVGGQGGGRILAVQTAAVGAHGSGELRLYPRPPLVLNGQLEAPGLAARNLSGTRIVFDAIPAAGRAGASIEVLAGPDSRFTASDLEPASYGLRVQAPPGLFAARARLGGRDVLGWQLDLAAGVPGGLRIELQEGAARLSGSVLQGQSMDRQSGRAGIAILEPLEPSPTANLRRIAPVSDGRFAFGSIAPGTYRIFATERFDPDLFGNAVFLGLISGQVRSVELRRHARSRVELRLIEAERIAAAARRAGLARF